MLFLSRSILLVIFLLSVLTLSGCGPSGIAVVPVKGTVVLDGKPVDQAAVVFVPVVEGRSTVGITDDKGEFYMITPGAKKSGCVPGKYNVSVSKKIAVDAKGRPMKVSSVASDKSGGYLAKEKNFLPDRFENPETSGLTADVKKRGTNHFIFDLDAK